MLLREHDETTEVRKSLKSRVLLTLCTGQTKLSKVQLLAEKLEEDAELQQMLADDIDPGSLAPGVTLDRYYEQADAAKERAAKAKEEAEWFLRDLLRISGFQLFHLFLLSPCVRFSF